MSASMQPWFGILKSIFRNELLNSFVRKHFKQLNIDENCSCGNIWRRKSAFWKWWMIALVFQKHGGKSFKKCAVSENKKKSKTAGFALLVLMLKTLLRNLNQFSFRFWTKTDKWRAATASRIWVFFSQFPKALGDIFNFLVWFD